MAVSDPDGGWRYHRSIGLCAGIAMARLRTRPRRNAPRRSKARYRGGANPPPQMTSSRSSSPKIRSRTSSPPRPISRRSRRKFRHAGEKPDPALQTELEGIATKHGFSNFAELDDVAANISIVMAGLDTESGNFVDPVEALRKERDDVQKDKTIPDTDKKQLIDELTEAINTTPQLQYKENVDIVKAHRAEIEKALQ